MTCALLTIVTLVQGTGDGSVGGFWWSLHFNWIPVPQRTRDAQKSKIDPYPWVISGDLLRASERDTGVGLIFRMEFRSPTMAGGLLAAHREYFFEIGGYGKHCTVVFISCMTFFPPLRLDDDMEVGV